MSRFASCTFSCVVLLGSSMAVFHMAVVHAATYSTTLTGSVRAVSLPALETLVVVGDTFSLSYIIDTSATDSSMDPQVGRYGFAVSGMNLQIGNYAASNIGPRHLTVINDFMDGRDSIELEFSSASFEMPPIGDFEADELRLQLVDRSGTALTSKALPSGPIDPADFDDPRGFTFFSLSFEHATTGERGGISVELDPLQSVPDPVSLSAAVLPGSRSVRTGSAATAFATIINSSSVDAQRCSIRPLQSIEADFGFQPTDPATNLPIGLPDEPVSIAAGSLQSFVLTFVTTGEINQLELAMEFDCLNSPPAQSIAGVNTFLLSASASDRADVIALVATQSQDGVVHLAGENTPVGAFSVASINLGSSASVTVEPVTTNTSVPMTLAICETNPATSECINPLVASTDPVVTIIDSGSTPTFSVFVAATQAFLFDPANTRIGVRFFDDQGALRGSTSVAPKFPEGP